MSSWYRVGLLLGIVGLAVTLSYALAAPPVDKPPAQAPAQPVKRFVKPLQPLRVDIDDPANHQNITDALTFPTDRKAKRSLEAAQDFIKEEAWGEAARLLQSLLDAREDIFVPVGRDGGGGWSSLWSEANRLINTMPATGRQFYELQYGSQAKGRLAEAKTKGDPQILAEVARRYLHTDAGAEATNLLGTYHLDRGRFIMAALCFDRLLKNEKADNLTPATLVKAVLAFRGAGDNARAEQAWSQLTRLSRDGVHLGDQNVPLEEVQKTLGQLSTQEQPPSPFDWSMYKGNPSRSAQGTGGPPFLEVKWTIPTIDTAISQQWTAQAVRREEDRQQPILPGSFPIASTVHKENGVVLPLLVFRTQGGLQAVNLQKDGKLEWETKLDGGLDSLVGDPKNPNQANIGLLNQWMPLYLQGSAYFLFENSTIGTITTDNSRVYAVDDLALPPHPSSPQLNQMMQMGGQPMSFGELQDKVYHSHLLAFDLSNGKSKWDLGGRGSSAGELSDTYFLGPPLPLGGKLYVLTEKNSELRLVCLDPPHEDLQPPTISWIQTLANVRDRMLLDPGRRVQAANLSFGEGILVCPTNAGVVFGIDLLTHSLAWAYSYREETPHLDPQQPMMRPFRGGAWMGQVTRQLNTDWKTSAPIIQDGKVVFTAPDAPAIHCLNLRDGKKVWKQNRADDLYLGGVYNGKVLLVGKSTCRALNLSDGKQAWKKETGLPSGQGVASDNIYYLPLKSAGQSNEPEVCSLDINAGNIIAHTKSRKKEVPGNLLFYEGDVISQTASAITAYPQLRVRLAQIDQSLKKNPRDPVGLTNRGELKLDKGDLQGAVDDLRTALATQPAIPEILPRTRTKLFETFAELFQRDFSGASDRYLDEFKEMCLIQVPSDATVEERQRLQKEQQRRQANYLCLIAKGRENQGRLDDAFQAYTQFAALSSNRELVSVIDEPAVKARPDVWAQGRIAAMVAKATAEQRKPLEKRITIEWNKVEGTRDLDGMRRFVSLFGSLFDVGKEARLQLAERLVEDNNFLEAELHLLQLRRQQEPHYAACAVEALARLMIRKGLLEDAAYWYRVLARDFGQVNIRDGKTGADFLKDLATDKRFLPYLEEQTRGWPPRADFKREKIHGAFQIQPRFAFEAEGESLPFFDRHQLVMNNGSMQIKLVDLSTNTETWSESLSGVGNVGYFYSGYPNGRFPYHLLGHLMVLNIGQMVYALDPISHRKLWERSLMGPAGMTHRETLPDKDGTLKLVFPDGYTQRIGEPGLVTPSCVCLHTRDGLIALDPLQGSVLWTKFDIPLRAEVFGDEHYIYVVEVHNENNVSAIKAFRALDGVSVDVPDFSRLYEKRLQIRGGKLLLADREATSVTLRLYDIQTGKDVWQKAFSPKAIILHCDDRNLAGVAEPDRDGTVTVVDLTTHKEVLFARIPPADLDHMQEVHLLQDKTQFYLACRKAEGPFNQWMGVSPSLTNGIRYIQCNGKLYVFDRKTNKVNWYEEIPNQMMVIDQFKDLPVLLFTAHQTKMVNQAGIRQGQQHEVTFRSYNKRTGKMLARDEFPNNHNAFYALTVDLPSGTIDLISYNLKIRHQLKADSSKVQNIQDDSSKPEP